MIVDAALMAMKRIVNASCNDVEEGYPRDYRKYEEHTQRPKRQENKRENRALTVKQDVCLLDGLRGRCSGCV